MNRDPSMSLAITLKIPLIFTSRLCADALWKYEPPQLMGSDDADPESTFNGYSRTHPGKLPRYAQH